MLVFSNILLELFGCRLQYFLKNNMLAKHTIGIFLFFIFNVLTDTEISNKSILYVLGMTIITYIWFVLTTRTPFYISIIVILLLVSVFAFDIYIQRYQQNSELTEDQQEQIDTMKNIRMTIVMFTFILTCVGVFIYYREKKIEYREKFNTFTFLNGNPKCKNYTPKKALLYQ